MKLLDRHKGDSMKFINASVLLTVVALSGCATTANTVGAQSELFSNSADRKECYSYDTQGRNMARNMPTAVGLGILGGLFPPLMIITAVASGLSAAADQAALPAKCGLTFDDAVKEAWTVSFYEKATALWTQKSGGGGIVASYIDGDDICSTHDIKMWRKDGSKRKHHNQQVEICRDEMGEPALKAAGAVTKAQSDIGPDKSTL